MRFIDNGPDIPDELLIARDEGGVLFFCGAGVSLGKARLPDFLTLAAAVIEELGSLTGSQARRLYDAAGIPLSAGGKSYVPVDRMFSSLDLEFDPQQVRDAVARALKPTPNVDLDAHLTLIDLSRGSDGRPRLITTNFDRLFEACDEELRSSGPPNLPVPDRTSDFEGIIHLHGRTKPDYSGISDDIIVLSSSDFGKAYLSDGWATHYIRRLMNLFKIVFVGYSADDPPVQYLLEALREEQSPISNIYAFQYGDEAGARELWLQKGVTPIAYGNSYDNLWVSLKAWAERARDFGKWSQKTMDEAAAGPSTKTPVFRGRIAHLASSPAGAAKFTSLKPQLPSTWLYVFDPGVRYLTPRRADLFKTDSEHFDAFEHFGLDSDEPPQPVDADDHFSAREVPSDAWSAFHLNRRDVIVVNHKEAGSFFTHSTIVPRLYNLAILLLQSLDQTPALWWAVGQKTIHQDVARAIAQQLRYSQRGCGEQLTKYWRYLLKAWNEPNLDIDQTAIEIKSRAKRDGWSSSLVREAIQLSKPRITIDRRLGVAPPMTLDANPADCIALDVEYPHLHQDFDFDVAQLPLAASLWRNLLIEAEQMEVEINAYISLDTTKPDDGERLDADAYGLTGPVIALTHLMEALAASDPVAAAGEVRAWGELPGLVFERLRIWASGRSDLTTGSQAAAVISELSDDTFWSYKHERDLLFALRDRWPDLPDEYKLSIELRLLTSAVPFLDESDPGEARERAAFCRLNTIQWLHSHGVVFSFDYAAEMAVLKNQAPSWRKESSQDTALPRVHGPYSVTTDTDPTSILDVPPDDLLPLDVPERKFRDTVERNPFAGYCVAKPHLAVQALRSAMGRGVEAVWLSWSTFFRETGQLETDYELDSEVIRLIDAMPPDHIAKIWYPLVDWAAQRAMKLEESGRGEFDLVWDKVIAAAELHPSGYKQKPSRDWSFESLNAIVGRLVLALLEMKLPHGQKSVPAIWLSRLNKALNLPGDHSRHALHLVARQSQWFYCHEPAWWDAQILPKVNMMGPDGDAFWSGFAKNTHTPNPQLFRLLKSAMFERICSKGKGERNLIGYLLIAWAEEPDPLVSDTELRDVLILCDDEVRGSAISFVGRWAAESQKWGDRVIPFLAKVWPKQRTVKSPQMSSALFRFASKLPQQFAPIIDVIAGQLVPLSRSHDLHLHCNIDVLSGDGIEALLIALERLLPSDRSEWPYEAERIIASIVTSGLGQGSRRDELQKRSSVR